MNRDYRKIWDDLNLRRPETTDSQHYWHVSESKWDSWAKEYDLAVGTKPKGRVQSKARNYAHAGRIEELEGKGEHPAKPCRECKKKGKRCTVYSAEEIGLTDVKRCGYCVCNGRSNCDALDDEEERYNPFC